MDDNALMARVQQGSRDAFDLLVCRHYGAAIRLAMQILHDDALALDAVQDAFAALYIHRMRYAPTFSFSTYLCALVRHKSIDLLRKQSKATLLPPEALAQLPPSETSPEALCIAHIFSDALFGAIDALDAQKKAVLLAYALHGKSYRTIALEQNLSVAQVKIILHRVRKALRHMKEEWS